MNVNRQPDATTQQREIRRERLQGRLEPEVCEFRDSRQTLQLATIQPNGLPSATYVPFAFDTSGYYILVSDIAVHGQNIKSNRNVSILLIEDENECKQIYARKRLSFDTQAQLLERDSDAWQCGIHALEQRFGEIIQNLSGLADFNLYLLVPNSGRYVKGFGQAFTISGDNLIDFVHLTDGHRRFQPNDFES